MRVLHVLPQWEGGGATRSVAELIRAMEPWRDVDVALLVLNPAQVSDAQREIPEVRVIQHGTRRRAPRHAIRTAVEAVSPEIIHSHLWPGALQVSMAFPSGGVPHLVHIRDTPPTFASPRWRHRAKTLLLRTLLRISRPRFVAVSQGAAEYTIRHLGVPQPRVSVVLNGIDPSRLAGLDARVPDGTFVFGAAGRYVREKGFHLLIEAFSQVHARHPNARLHLVGSGSMQSAYDQQIGQLGLRSAVEIRGYSSDMAGFLSSIDAYVCASLSSEGMSRALIEAMMVGLPVVSTTAPGCGEIVEDRKSGLLVPVGDVPKMVQAMECLVQDTTLCGRLGAAAREFATANLTIKRVASEIYALYQTMLAEQ